MAALPEGASGSRRRTASSASARTEALAFVKPWWQRLADATSVAMVATVLLVLLAWAL